MNASLFSAVRWNTISTLTRYSANLFQIIYIARTLGPEHFATVSLVLALVTILRPLLDLGSSIAVIHYQTLKSIELPTIYWLNIFVSTVIALMLVGISPLFSVIFTGTELPQNIIFLVALHLPLYGAGQLFSALAEKQIKFGRLAIVEVISATTGVLSAIVYLERYEPTAVVIGVSLVCTNFVRLALLHLLLREPAALRFKYSLQASKKFLKFGATSTSANAVNTIYSQADLFLGAKFLSASSFGLYSLPRDIGLKFANAIINPIITRIALPVLASNQHNLPKARTAYHSTVLFTCSVSFPVYFLLFLFADQVIDVLMTDEWANSAYILKLIAIWGLIRAAYNPIGYLCFAFGKPFKLLYWHSMMFVPTFLILAASLRYGVEGLMIGNIILAVFSLILSWGYIAKNIIGSTYSDLAHCFVRPAICGFCAAFPSSLALNSIALSNQYLLWFLTIFVYAFTYLFFSFFINKKFFTTLLKLVSSRLI